MGLFSPFGLGMVRVASDPGSSQTLNWLAHAMSRAGADYMESWFALASALPLSGNYDVGQMLEQASAAVGIDASAVQLVEGDVH